MSKKIIVCLILVFASVFSSTLPVFALGETEEELVKQTIPFSQTTVEQDFERLKEQPENNFNEENYPAIDGGKPQLLTVVEDCNLPSSYDLYIYIYNPGLFDLNWCNQEFAQLSYTGVSYYKYPLTFIDDTEDHRFIKVKVNMPESHWKHLNKSKRDLFFSGFELSVVQNAKTKVIEYPAGSFLQQGVGKGDLAVKMTFEGNGQGKSKMTKAIGIDALQLDLNMTYYRTTNANSADGGLNQLATVYFLVPNKFFDKYGMISDIHYRFSKYVNIPVFVANFNIKNPLEKDFFYPFVYYSDLANGSTSHIVSELSVVISDKFGHSSSLKEKVSDGDYDTIILDYDLVPQDENLFFDFYTTRSWGVEKWAFFLRDSMRVTTTELNEYFAGHSKQLGNDFEIIEKKVSCNDPDNFLNVESYVTSTTLWERLKDFGFSALKIQDDSYSANPICVIESDDLNLSDKEFSKRYLIDEDDIFNVKQKLNEANSSDCSMVLLRVDVSKVSSKYLKNTAYLEDQGIFQEKLKWNGRVTSTCKAEGDGKLLHTLNTVYKDVDVIDISFQNDQGKYVIPVISDPVEIYVPPTVLPEDVVDKLFPVKPKVSYLGLIILIITTMVVVMLTPTLAPAIGHFFGSPIDKWAKKQRQRRRKK